MKLKLGELHEWVQHDAHLQALISIIKNQHYPNGEFAKAVDSWNLEHKDWLGAYVEEDYAGHGRSLVVMMDVNGNVNLRADFK